MGSRLFSVSFNQFFLRNFALDPQFFLTDSNVAYEKLFKYKFGSKSKSVEFEVRTSLSYVNRGTVWYGTESDGTERYGTESDGTERYGIESDGTERNGTNFFVPCPSLV